MISTTLKTTSTFAQFVRKGTFGAPQASENWEVFPTPPNSFVYFDTQGRVHCLPVNTAEDTFDRLPASSVAASADILMITGGTGTVQVARATKAGINLKTKSSTPAQNDAAFLQPVASSQMIGLFTAPSQLRFSTRIRANQNTGVMISAGLNQTAAVDPTANGGEGAAFLFDPAGAAAQSATYPAGLNKANWIITQKVAGVWTFADSGIAVQTGVDYELVVQLGPDLIPLFYINGVQIAFGTAGAIAQTSSTSTAINAVVGLIITAAAPSGTSDMDIRFVMLERFIG